MAIYVIAIYYENIIDLKKKYYVHVYIFNII